MRRSCGCTSSVLCIFMELFYHNSIKRDQLYHLLPHSILKHLLFLCLVVTGPYYILLFSLYHKKYVRRLLRVYSTAQLN